MNPGRGQPRGPDRGIAALLSQSLVAYTVEIDNEFERRMSEAGYPAAYLSFVIWCDLLRHVPPTGIAVRDLIDQSRATPERVRAQLGCMERWGVVSFQTELGREPPTVKHRRSGRELRDGFGSGRGIRGEWKVCLTPMGQRALSIWPALFDEIESRWKSRFGNAGIARLRKSLESIAAPADEKSTVARPLPMLLWRALQEFAEEFDRRSDDPLWLCASAIRILGSDPIPESEIPRRTGGSPETSGIGWQLKRYIVVESDPARTRGKVVRLNPKGLAAPRKYHRLTGEIEQKWETKFGKQTIRQLRESLQVLFEAPAGKPPRIATGLIPPPGVRRAGADIPALGRREPAPAARKRRRDLVEQTESFLRDPAGTLPHYPLWDINRGFGP